MTPTVDWLDDVRRAQTAGTAGAPFDVALSEIGRGRKQSHWVWYVFPQIPGLGRSAMNTRFAVPRFEAAQSFLLDGTTGPNFHTILAAVSKQLSSGVELASLMQGDQRKFVSSVTLMAAAASAAGLDEVGGLARSVLEQASRQGFEPCRQTLDWLEAERHRGDSNP